MNEALIRLPASEEESLLERVRGEGLPLDRLRCDYTRQQGSGTFKSRHRRFRNAHIEYDLMLCEHCGNLEGSGNNDPYCPAKLRALQERAEILTEGRES